MSGKGDKRRPQAVSDSEMDQRWAAIFQASQVNAAELEAERIRADTDGPERRQRDRADRPDGFGPFN